MTATKKLLKCYFLRVFAPPTRAPHLERQGQAQARGGLGQAQGGQVPRSARQAPGLLGMLGCKPSHVSLAASAASASAFA
jgi:hypothetical protein